MLIASRPARPNTSIASAVFSAGSLIASRLAAIRANCSSGESPCRSASETPKALKLSTCACVPFDSSTMFRCIKPSIDDSLPLSTPASPATIVIRWNAAVVRPSERACLARTSMFSMDFLVSATIAAPTAAALATPTFANLASDASAPDRPLSRSSVSAPILTLRGGRAIVHPVL